MKVSFVNKHGDKYPESYNLEYEIRLLEQLIHKGFRPVKGDYFNDEEGNGIKIKWVLIVDEYNLIVAIDI